jgi:hypothetical protein
MDDDDQSLDSRSFGDDQPHQITHTVLRRRRRRRVHLSFQLHYHKATLFLHPQELMSFQTTSILMNRQFQRLKFQTDVRPWKCHKDIQNKPSVEPPPWSRTWDQEKEERKAQKLYTVL